jgi:hypothetical protein
MSGVPESVRLVTEPGDLVIEPRRWALRHDILPPGGIDILPPRGIAALPSGTRVVLTDDRPGGRIRLRRRAARLGLHVSREYVVLPSWRRPSFVVEDHPSTLAWLWTTLATIPPGVSRGSLLAEAAVRAGHHRRVLSVVGSVAPGRVVIARKP